MSCSLFIPSLQGTSSCTWPCFSICPSFQLSADSSAALASTNLCSVKPLSQKPGRDFLAVKKTRKAKVIINFQPAMVSYCSWVSLFHMCKLNPVRALSIPRNWILQQIRLFFLLSIQNVHLYCRWIYICLCVCIKMLLHSTACKVPELSTASVNLPLSIALIINFQLFLLSSASSACYQSFFFCWSEPQPRQYTAPSTFVKSYLARK